MGDRENLRGEARQGGFGQDRNAHRTYPCRPGLSFDQHHPNFRQRILQAFRISEPLPDLTVLLLAYTRGNYLG
jgi:hypothetical protein